jgi:hypothetical protein
MTMLSNSQQSQEPKRSEFLQRPEQQQAHENELSSSELPLHRRHMVKPAFRLESLRKSQGLNWKDSWDSSSSNNSEAEEDEYEERSNREEGEKDESSTKNRVLPGSPASTVHANAGTPTLQGNIIRRNATHTGIASLVLNTSYPLSRSSSSGRRRKLNETTFASSSMSDPKLHKGSSDTDLRVGKHEFALHAVDDFFGPQRQRQSYTRQHRRRHSFPYHSSEPKRESPLHPRVLPPQVIKASSVPVASPSFSRYRSISFGYPIVPAFSTPRQPASPSIKRMQLSTLPGLSGPLGRSLRSSASGIEKTTERPIEEVIPNFEYLHFSLLRHTLRREVAPDEILSREDCLAVMNSKLSQVVLRKEDTSFALSRIHYMPPFRRNFLCDMHTTAAEQLQHINKEMRKHAVSLRLRHEENPRRMKVSHKLKSGDIDLMVVPRVEENEVLSEDAFSDCSPGHRQAFAPSIVAVVKSKTKEESDCGSRSIEASISILTSMDTENCENESKYDHEVIQIYDAEENLLSTSPTSNYSVIKISTSHRLASDVHKDDDGEEKTDASSNTTPPQAVEDISPLKNAIDSTSPALEKVLIEPTLKSSMKQSGCGTAVNQNIKVEATSSGINNHDSNCKLNFPTADQGSFVSCLNSTGTESHTCCMEKDGRGASAAIGVNIDQSLVDETSSDVKNPILPESVVKVRDICAAEEFSKNLKTGFLPEGECQQTTSKVAGAKDVLLVTEPQPEEPPTIGRVTQLSFNSAIPFDAALTSHPYKDSEVMGIKGSSSDVGVNMQPDFTLLPPQTMQHNSLSSDSEDDEVKSNTDKDDQAENPYQCEVSRLKSSTPTRGSSLSDGDAILQESHIQPLIVSNIEKNTWIEGPQSSSSHFYPFFQVSPSAHESLSRSKSSTQNMEQPHIVSSNNNGHIVSYSPVCLGRHEENVNIGEILSQHHMHLVSIIPKCDNDFQNFSNTFTEGSDSAASYPHVSEHSTPGRFRRRLENAVAVKKNVDGALSDDATSQLSTKNDVSPDTKLSAHISSSSLPPHMIRRKLLLPDLSDVLTGEDMTDVDLLDNYMYCNHNQDIGKFPVTASRQTDRNDSSISSAVTASIKYEKSEQLREAVALTMSISASAQSTYSQRSQMNPSINSLPEDDFEHPFAKSSRPLGLIGLANSASVDNFCESSTLKGGEFCNVDNIPSSCNSISHAMEFVLGFLPSADDLSRSCSNGKEQQHQQVSCKDAVLQCWNDVHANSVTVCNVKANQAPCGPATMYRQTSAKNKCRVHGQLFTPPTLKLRSQSLTSLPEDDFPRFDGFFESLPSRIRRLNNGEEDYSHMNPRWAMAVRGSDGSPYLERGNGRPPLIPPASSDFPYEGSFEGRHHPGLPLARKYFQSAEYSSHRQIPRHLFQPDRANAVKTSGSPKAIIWNEKVKDNEYFFGQTYDEDKLFLTSQTNSL